MSLLPCPNQIGCDSDYPVSNYSSEDADPRSFIGFSTGTAPTSSFTKGGGGGPPSGGPDQNDTGGGVDGAIGTAQTGTGGDPPPLGSDYDNAIVTTFAESTESQPAAWDAAGNDNVSAMTVSSNTGDPGGGIILNPGRIAPSVFGNDIQQCSVNCPDSSTFTYTVPANTFRALSKSKANAAALSYACKQSALNQMCLSSINGSICVGSVFLQTVIANTVNVPVTFVITSGDLPDWVTAEVGTNSVQLSGTPTSGDIADTSFTLTATDALGFSMSKSYTISVTACNCDITTTTLDKFDQGQFYSFQLVSTAIEPALWEMVSGTLPSGLSLDAGGVIFGTANVGPPANGDQTFTVKVTGDDGSTCSKTLTIQVIDYSAFPPGKKWRIAGYVDGSVFNSACCGGSANPWTGEFILNLIPAQFRGSLSAGPNGKAVNTFLLNGVTLANEWWVVLQCISVSAYAWTGRKIGSNQGPQLDSPAGVYTFIDPGNTYCLPSGLPATITIEEY